MYVAVHKYIWNKNEFWISLCDRILIWKFRKWADVLFKYGYFDIYGVLELMYAWRRRSKNNMFWKL